MQALQPRKRAGRGTRTARTVVALVLREMATTYGRSAGGYLWAVLDPVGAIALLTIVFSYMFHAPPLGKSFPLFYASGYLPFMLFNDISRKMATAIRFSKPLLAYPSVTIVDALLARFLLGLLTHMMVIYIVLSGVLFFFDTRAILNLPDILMAVAMAAALAAGIGTLNCYLMTAFPVWERTWSIAMRPLFILSAVFFTFDTMPKSVRDILWFNPLIHVIGEMRKGIYPTYAAAYVSQIYVFAVSIATLALGLFLLSRNYRKLVNE